MRTFITFFLFALSFLLSNCFDKSTLESDLKKTVIIVDEKDYGKIFNTFEIIDTATVDFIRLDTKKGIIGTIDKLIVTDNRFIILDKTTQKVWIFSLRGEYLNDIQAQGKGPNEYLRAHTITYKEPDLIGILDDSQRNILWFNTLGEFIEKRGMPYYACDVHEEPGYMHVMYRYIHENAPSDDRYYYHKMHLGGDSSKYAFPYYTFGLFFTVEDPFFIANDSNLLIRNPFDNGLYTYKNGELEKKYDINFSKPTVPYNSYMNEGNSQALTSEIESGNYQGNVSQVTFTSTHLSMRYSENKKEGGAEVVNIVYDISSKESKVFSGITVDDDFEIYYQHPVASHKERFFSILYPHTLQNKTLKRLNILGDLQAINPVVMSFKYSTIKRQPL